MRDGLFNLEVSRLAIPNDPGVHNIEATVVEERGENHPVLKIQTEGITASLLLDPRTADRLAEELEDAVTEAIANNGDAVEEVLDY